MRIKLHKWSLARNQNVNTVYSLFSKIEHIEVLDDNRNIKLVVIRQDYLNVLKNNETVKSDKDKIIELQNVIISMLTASASKLKL